ncbi:monalysin family beta-barrel pore-forming toxin [Pseudomonas sp. NPDC008258]|uniref:monalysin family beta-barrel pore-forming toxin n=1 Tax=Pseudomonas sp. NPDC008258 TaxID=3364418 RepID=UPI0036E49B4E
MSFIDQDMIKAIGDFPHKRGTYEIEKYLYGMDGKVNPGCWVFGDTVYGDLFLGNQNWGTYSTPILAYLEYLGMARVPGKVSHTEEVSTVEGYSRSFTSSLETEVSLGAGFLGSAIGGKLTSSSTEGISKTHTRSQKIEMEGPGIFNFYQMHMVYAHCVTGAGGFADFFKYAKTKTYSKAGRDDREDLCIVTSIATSSVITVSAENSIRPLGWDEIQEAALMKGHQFPGNSGRWIFNYGAYHTPGNRY